MTPSDGRMDGLSDLGNERSEQPEKKKSKSVYIFVESCFLDIMLFRHLQGQRGRVQRQKITHSDPEDKQKEQQINSRRKEVYDDRKN